MKSESPDLLDLAERLAAAESRIRRLWIALWIVAGVCVIGLFRNALWIVTLILLVGVGALAAAGWMRYWYLPRQASKDQDRNLPP
jgi:hypothetical protein